MLEQRKCLSLYSLGTNIVNGQEFRAASDYSPWPNLSDTLGHSGWLWLPTSPAAGHRHVAAGFCLACIIRGCFGMFISQCGRGYWRNVTNTLLQGMSKLGHITSNAVTPKDLPRSYYLTTGKKDWEVKPECHFLSKHSEPIFPGPFTGKCLHSNDELMSKGAREGKN